MEYLKSVGDAVVDRSPEELIGAILVALALALIISGLYALGRRKVRDSAMLVTCLTIISSVTSMALTGGYLAALQKRQREEVKGTNSGGFPGLPPVSIDELVARRIMQMADGDGDHSLSAEEAAGAAAAFVRTTDGSGKGSIDIPSLTSSIQNDIMMNVFSDAQICPTDPGGYEANPGPGAIPPTDKPGPEGTDTRE